GDANARRDALPVLDRSNAAGFRIVLAVRALAVVLPGVDAAGQNVALLRLADEPVVADAEVERRALIVPAVLREQAGVRLDAVAAIGRQTERCRGRHAVGV